METVEDQLGHFITEWHVQKEKWFTGEAVDPVFEGIVKDFCTFDNTMQDIYKKVESFMKGIESLAEGLVTLSESAIAGLTQIDDPLIKSDTCKMKEATNQITRSDAPHSAIAKLRRDMDFNIMNPIRNHLINNRNLKQHLEKRRRRLLELNIAKKQYDECVKRNLSHSDRRFLQAQSTFESAKMSFHEVDKHIFEWLYILEEYKGDILDSTLQTLKYLQYEFFATSAHAISGVLPARMEFRPMVEMTPEHLEAQVEMELQEAEENDEAEEVVTDFSVRLIGKLAKDNKTKPGEGVDSCANDPGPALPVDPLSLSSLLSQGFEEGPARRALRVHRNNTQAALDWLINGGAEGEGEKAPEDGVRMPTTVKRVQKLKARRRAQQEKLRRKEEEEDREDQESTKSLQQRAKEAAAVAPPNGAVAAPPDDLIGLDAPTPTQAAPPANSAMDLLNMEEEPPPPTDFTKHVETAPLPPQRSFDLTRCEKQPLPASVAAGTASLRNTSALGPQTGTGDLPPELLHGMAPSTSADGTMAPAPMMNLSPMAGAGMNTTTSGSLASLWAGSTQSGAPPTALGLAPAQLAAAQELAAKAHISPEQLLLAAQQLAAAQAQAPTLAVPNPYSMGPVEGAASFSALSQPSAAYPPPQAPEQPAQSFQSLDPLASNKGLT